MRADVPKGIKGSRAKSGAPGRFITWQEIHALVTEKREETGYNADEEGNKYEEKKEHDTSAKAMGQAKIGSAEKERPPKTPKPEE